MVAKGHDFPDVELGVVVDADATLRFPDFRAEERTFALVAQLAGRAGRGGARGRVLVQTLAPDAPVDRARRPPRRRRLPRRRARAPPGAALPAVLDADPRRLLVAAARAPRTRRRPPCAPRLGDDALGPAPLFRLRGRERSQVVVKAADRARAVAAVGAAVQAAAGGRARTARAAFSVDVDPQ